MRTPRPRPVAYALAHALCRLLSLLSIARRATLLTAALLAIYPDNHFDYSTKVTGANIDKVIGDVVDAGKTLFVRFIASEG